MCLELRRNKKMKTHALRYYMHDGPAAFRFELAGDLNDEGARRLERDWRTASSVIGDRLLIVDITFVTSAAKEARILLARWHASGARLIANSDTSRSLAQSILGSPLPEPPAKGATWFPFLAAVPVKLAILLLIATAVFTIDADAATLKPETVADWEDYVHTVSNALEDRCRPGHTFLWIDEAPERLAKVREGEIVVDAAPGHVPLKVQGGLIHHWMGAAFLPNAQVDNILDVIRDYNRYRDFYPPSVVESKVLVRSDSDEKFTMKLVNHEFFATMALDADYRVTNVRLDHDHFYSVAKTIRVQQLENYGRPREHMIPEGQGGGYIWKLFSIARLEQRDGGVYIEMETVALSRGIPAAFRIIADPIVRRVSRDAMLTAIKQTQDAVRCNSLIETKPATCPATRTTTDAVTVRRLE
jgi:hypothetical protein